MTSQNSPEEVTALLGVAQARPVTGSSDIVVASCQRVCFSDFVSLCRTENPERPAPLDARAVASGNAPKPTRPITISLRNAFFPSQKTRSR